jgi:hypothetical protein
MMWSQRRLMPYMACKSLQRTCRRWHPRLVLQKTSRFFHPLVCVTNVSPAKQLQAQEAHPTAFKKHNGDEFMKTSGWRRSWEGKGCFKLDTLFALCSWYRCLSRRKAL